MATQLATSYVARPQLTFREIDDIKAALSKVKHEPFTTKDVLMHMPYPVEAKQLGHALILRGLAKKVMRDNKNVQTRDGAVLLVKVVR